MVRSSLLGSLCTGCRVTGELHNYLALLPSRSNTLSAQLDPCSRQHHRLRCRDRQHALTALSHLVSNVVHNTSIIESYRLQSSATSSPTLRVILLRLTFLCTITFLGNSRVYI
ncbi:hypothetical protein KC19_12G147900 [Ceratodon purpureus]|uniref:Uncharacterized protein n=1 Tax=Ceratodon purpureus TaxID=3225 RepID=A0A8T0G795_CERPU|nr:hypothetical protein KC19_12G147900 [Ceratodon purpureus]